MGKYSKEVCQHEINSLKKDLREYQYTDKEKQEIQEKINKWELRLNQ